MNKHTTDTGAPTITSFRRDISQARQERILANARARAAKQAEREARKDLQAATRERAVLRAQAAAAKLAGTPGPSPERMAEASKAVRSNAARVGAYAGHRTRNAEKAAVAEERRVEAHAHVEFLREARREARGQKPASGPTTQPQPQPEHQESRPTDRLRQMMKDRGQTVGASTSAGRVQYEGLPTPIDADHQRAAELVWDTVDTDTSRAQADAGVEAIAETLQNSERAGRTYRDTGLSHSAAIVSGRYSVAEVRADLNEQLGTSAPMFPYHGEVR